MKPVGIALVHYPIKDRQGACVTTAITNLDLHDMARSACTYGVAPLFVVHPVKAQRDLADRIQRHWVEGSGGKRIPPRATALKLLRIVPSLQDACTAFAGSSDRSALEVWVTSASATGSNDLGFADARRRIEDSEKPILIVFGTGWGLADDVIRAADVALESIRANHDTSYNHLSVRAACAIVLDRLFGARCT